MEVTKNLEKERLEQILEHQSDNLQDAILSCMTNLNLLTTFTPDEIGMTKEQMEISEQKEKSVAEGFIFTKERVDYWIEELNRTEKDFDIQRQHILQEFHWLKIN